MVVVLVLAGSLATADDRANEAGDLRAVGVARVDITPDYPVRLSGFGFRRTESEGVRQKIWAKALAIGADSERPAVLITVDNLGVPDRVVDEVAARLKKKSGLDRDRLTVTSSHTHTAPMLTGVCPTLYGMPIPPEHQEHIDRYTRELVDRLEQVALEALADRKPARLAWGIGSVDLAVNRRTKGGPVDHELPVLVVRDSENAIRAIYVSYACHCVTLSDNLISGDWAGFAQEQIERNHPQAIALVSIGCGADSNPRSGVTGAKGEVAEAQGVEIAVEVDRLLKGGLNPVTGPLEVRRESIALAFDAPPKRDEFAEKAKREDAIGYHARVQLARLDRGEALRNKLYYPIQTWTFGNSLAMVFLPGEVVVDYSLRLKRELDGKPLWINAYSNDDPCYIPSERILKEGGYEGGGAMVYYDQPTKLAAGLEEQIIGAVKRQLRNDVARLTPPAPPYEGGEKPTTPREPIDQPAHAGRSPTQIQGAQALSPDESLAAIRTRPELTVELVAAEPLVASPVAIDFGPDGKLWVAEMADYPLGLDGNYQPGGRIRVLESTKEDGRFDKATVFLEGVPFPTGVTVWRKGVLVCAAPDILYAEDTDGDGRADKVRKLFSGFGTHNYQARVNSLEYGLDGWVYGSCGMFGGTISNDRGKPAVALGDRDFRIKPDEGIIEPASGRTQQGRVRDDWGNWFGCDNTNLCRHYPLADEYVRRNPHFAPEVLSVNVPEGPDPNRLFPLAANLQLFKLSGPAGRTTAACGLGIYRDDLLGEEFRGNAFVCEPVNLLVHRMQLVPKGFTFTGRRAAGETESEFLASSDPWFRPVQVRTGPDGGLWIVDMYRQVIEHPRWIPVEDLAKLDVRAGFDKGRIYRVRPAGRELRKWTRLDRLDSTELVAALDSPNGWQRDMAGQMLVWNDPPGTAAEALDRLVERSSRPETRVSALCVLDQIAQVPAETLRAALKDAHPGVRRHAPRLAERDLNGDGIAFYRSQALLKDPDAQVRLQLALSLGEWRNMPSNPLQPQAQALAYLLLGNADDPILVGAVFSSLRSDTIGVVVADTLAGWRNAKVPARVLSRLCQVAAPLGDKPTLSRVIADVCFPRGGKIENWQLEAMAGIYEALERRGQTAEDVIDDGIRGLTGIIAVAENASYPGESDESRQIAAINLLSRVPGQRMRLLKELPSLLTPDSSPAVQAAAASALGRIADESSIGALTNNWRSYSPALKSHVIDILLSREQWHARLLNEIPATDIDATRRQLLLTSRNADIRKLAEERFAGAPASDRQKVLEDYRDVAALGGDRARGQQVFAKACSVCHRLGEKGYAVGPDLAAVANKTPQYLLQEILDPNRNVDSRYVAYVALTKEGRAFSGLLASETAGSITLKGQEGKQQVILRSDLEELQSSSMSLMPIGLEKDLSKQDLADLIAYLAASGPLPKQFAGNLPAVVKPANAGLALLATNGEIYGNQIAFESPLRNVGCWHDLADHVVWTVELEKPGRFDVWLDWACDDAVAGNKFVFTGGRDELKGAVTGTGGWDRYRQEKIGDLELPAGMLRLSLRPAGPAIKGALMDLRGIHLVAPGISPVFATGDPVAEAPPISDVDPAVIARQILDDARPSNGREDLVKKNVDRAAELVAMMTADLKPDPKEEYRRIPWIWRLAVAAGRKNDTRTLQKLLDASLPKSGESLRDWQAVVIGGGIINGVSEQWAWPLDRMNELLKDQPELTNRWRQALDQAAAMADNEMTRTGTRYDALRIIALDGWQARAAQLTKYLSRDVNEELQMGAVSATSDIDAPEAAAALVTNFGNLTSRNRKLAVDGLLRTEPRTVALIEALEAGRIKPGDLNDLHRETLRKLKIEALRARAEKALSQQ